MAKPKPYWRSTHPDMSCVLQSGFNGKVILSVAMFEMEDRLPDKYEYPKLQTVVR
jgi:hypothetical protein